MKHLRPLVIFAVLIGGCFAAEYASHRRVNPTGRASSLSEYLAWRPSADQFAAIRINGKPHVIAYGPAGGLLPSGPSAYVFDDTGRLVDWSPDIGDDPQFDQRWNAQKSRGPAHLIPRTQVQQLAATRPAGQITPPSRTSAIPIHPGATVKGTLLLAILTIKSSYARNIEHPLDDDGDVPDTLQWWIGDQTWRIRTYALDHDIHTHSVARTGPEVLQLAMQNNAKHYANVTTAQHVLHFEDCHDANQVARVLSDAGLPNRLEVATGQFAFWKPDEARYHTQSTPQ